MLFFRTVRFVIIIFAVVFLGFQANSNAQQIVVPNQFSNQSGLDFQSLFNCDNSPGVGQSIFPADQLIRGTIIGISTRLFPGSEGFGPVTIPNVTIKMSTTNADPLNPSATFADNVGPDETIVFQGDIILEAPACDTDPCPFPPLNGNKFTTPFDYNPANGNLLIETILPACEGGVPAFVGQDFTDELVSVVAMGVNPDQGIFINTIITQVTYSSRVSPIPVISQWGLIAMAGVLGLVGFIAIRKKYVTS